MTITLMKTLCLSLLLITATANAQTTFAPIGARWTYFQRYAFAPDSMLFSVEAVGDTLIEGVPCSVLEPSMGGGCMPFHHYVGTRGDSVLFWSPAANAFRTLYVFGLPNGANWTTPADYRDDSVNDDVLEWTVTNTGSVVVDGMALRTVDVSVLVIGEGMTVPLSTGTIWERAGDLWYMWPWIYGACDEENNGPLRCYEDPDISWMDPALPQCALSVGIHERTQDPEALFLPSIAAPGAALSLHLADVSGAVYITVLEMTGRIVRARHPMRDGDVLSLGTSGAYLVLAEGPGRSVRQRILIE